MPRRQVVQYEDRSGHRNPIPVCVTLGDLILPSVIGTGGGNADPRASIEQAFVNMKKIIEGAGGSLDGIGKITIFLKDFAHREFVNESWVKMFPDEDDRPGAARDGRGPGRKYRDPDGRDRVEVAGPGQTAMNCQPTVAQRPAILSRQARLTAQNCELKRRRSCRISS